MAGICAGKSTIADYFVEQHGFVRLNIARKSAIPASEKSISQAPFSKLDTAIGKIDEQDQSFDTAESLVDYVTKRWYHRWVTTDVWDEGVLDQLLRRPFFILVSVEGPVSTRWRRFKRMRVILIATLGTIMRNWF